MLRFRGSFLDRLWASPARPAPDADATPAERPGFAEYKGHLRALCEGVTLKADLVDGGFGSHDWDVGRPGW